MGDTASSPFHVGLTPALVTDAAVDLTRETHLSSWSIRDLAGRLGVAPSVIYHHVGGRDLLCRHVVEHVLDQIELPPTELDWQEWFRQLLHALGPLVAAYPGTAKWLLMHGPTLPAAMPTLEAGTAALRRAGFGKRIPFAYSLLLNNAMSAISMGDDRLRHEDDGPRDHATIMAELQAMPTASDDVRALGRDFIGPFARGGETAVEARFTYYRFVVDTTIAGLERTAR